MGFLGMVFTGLVVGLLARALKPGNDKMGILMTICLGIIGALVAGYVGHALNFYAPGEPAGLLASTLGAIALLVIMGAVFGRRSRI